MPDGEEKDDKQAQEKPDQADSGRHRERKPIWPWFVAGVIVLGFIGVVLAIIFVPTASVWTDDAYVSAHFATIAPRVSGQVTAVDADDNQTVDARQMLVQLDDRDYKASLASDEAALARDEAQENNVAAQIARLPAQIAQARSNVVSSSAQLRFALANASRYRNLAATGAGSVQERQQATRALQQAQASQAGAEAALSSTAQQLPVLQAQQASALAAIRAEQASVHQARLNLSYTRVLAPLRGMIAQRSVQVGNYVGPGTALMALVPLNRLYVTANYRETALAHVLPGQHARIHIDAYNLTLDGVVDGVPAASAASFAPIEPNNATGNFTKIVQRLPVRILISPGQPDALLLRMGLSVEVTIHTGLANVKADQNGRAARVTAAD